MNKYILFQKKKKKNPVGNKDSKSPFYLSLLFSEQDIIDGEF